MNIRLQLVAELQAELELIIEQLSFEDRWPQKEAIAIAKRELLTAIQRELNEIGDNTSAST